MQKGINKVILVGRLEKDSELESTSDGRMLANIYCIPSLYKADRFYN